MAEPSSSTQTQIFFKREKNGGKGAYKTKILPIPLFLFFFGDWERQKHSPFDFLIETRSQNQLKSAPELERYNKTHTNIKSRH